ncbi:MAG TPA: EAL domain-containing protein [Candidatus Limnocylindrales bacterium]|nr:EAL domain-containing protein [Candidatus Limnocylindrales bacterium]
MRLFKRSGRIPERLLWSRDERFVAGLADGVPDARVVVIASGAVLIGSGEGLSDAYVASRAGAIPYGLVALDPGLPEIERYLSALADAVQQSGIADRIGMLTSPVAGYHKVIDAFVALRDSLVIQFQPLVSLETMEAVGYESLARPSRAVGSIDGVVAAAVTTGRTTEVDRLVADRVITRTARLQRIPPHVTINVLPASLADAWFEPRALAERVRAAGLAPSLFTVECTEQQSTPDQAALARRVRQLRRQGFGFAIDDAGAGYASFALIAALRPSLIKIDREIVRGISRTTAKQALVEAFVGFSHRIGAQLAAEGIERTADLETLKVLGVQLGQGYLLGRPASEPLPARRPRSRVSRAQLPVTEG